MKIKGAKKFAPNYFMSLGWNVGLIRLPS